MSNKFLSGVLNGDISALTNGTASLYLKSLRINDLEANKDVLSDKNKFLITGAGGSFITNPYNGVIQSTGFKGNFIQDISETSNIYLSNSEINLVSSSVKINGQPIENGGTTDLQGAYDNSTIAETKLSTNKPYTIKAVDTSTLLNIDGDTKNVIINGPIDTTDFVRYEGGVDYLNPPDINTLSAVGYVDNSISNLSNTYSVKYSNDIKGWKSSVPAKVICSLRRVNPNYTGPLVSIRNSLNNTIDIYADSNSLINKTVYDAHVALGDGTGYISKIYDQTGNGNHFEQITPTKQPTINWNGLIPEILFNTGDQNRHFDSINTTGTMGINTGIYAISTIFKTNADPNFFYFIYGGATSGEYELYLGNIAVIVNIANNGVQRSYNIGSWSTNTYRTITSLITATDNTIRYDGTTFQGQPGGGSTIDENITWGSRGNEVFDFENNINELIIWDIIPSDEILGAIEADQLSLWANSTLPTTNISSSYEGILLNKKPASDFVIDEEVVNKAYVDNQIANIPQTDLTDLESKTQNISLAETDATKTTFTQDIELKDNALKFTSGNYTSSLENYLLSISNINNTRTTLSENELRFNNSTNDTRLIQDIELFNIESSAPISFKIDTAEKIKVESNKTTFNNNLVMTNGYIEVDEIYKATQFSSSLILYGDVATSLTKDTYIKLGGTDIDIFANSDITIKTNDGIVLEGSGLFFKGPANFENDFIHSGNNVQFNGTGSLQIQNAGTVQIQPTGDVDISIGAEKGVLISQGDLVANNRIECKSSDSSDDKYARIFYDYYLLSTATTFTYYKLEGSVLKIECVDIPNPTNAQIDFNLGFNTRNVLRLKNDKCEFFNTLKAPVIEGGVITGTSIALQSTGDISLQSSSRVFVTSTIGTYIIGPIFTNNAFHLEQKTAEEISTENQTDSALYYHTDGNLHFKKHDGTDTTIDIDDVRNRVQSLEDNREIIYRYNPYANTGYHKIWEDAYIELFFNYTGSTSSAYRQPVYRIKQMPTNYSKWCHNFTYRKGGATKTGSGTGIYTNTYLPFYASSYSWSLNTSYNFEDTAIMNAEIFPEQESGSNYYEIKFIYGSRNSLITKINKFGNDQSSFGLVDEFVRTDIFSIPDDERLTTLENRLNELTN